MELVNKIWVWLVDHECIYIHSSIVTKYEKDNRIIVVDLEVNIKIELISLFWGGKYFPMISWKLKECDNELLWLIVLGLSSVNIIV